MTTEVHWLNYFKGLKRRLNLGWFLQFFEPAFLLCLLILLCIVFVLKSYSPAFYHETEYLYMSGVFLSFLFSCIFAWRKARKRFFNLRDVVLQYDSKYQFNCILLQAYDKQQEWPHLPDNFHESFSFEWRHNASFFIMTIIIISSAQWIPIAAKELDIPVEQPASWRESDRLISQLEEDDALEQQQIQKFRQKLKELQGKEAEEWFKHSTLEASESLLNSLRQTSQEHQQNMSDLAAMLQKMDALQQYLNKIKKEEISVSKDFESQLERTIKQLEQEWDDEMKDLMRQYLKMQKELMQDLKSVKPSDYVRNNRTPIDKEKLKKWLERMKQQIKENCPTCSAESKENCSSCGAGQLPGMGGINRGPGYGGDPLGDENAEEVKGKIETVYNQDMKNMRMGELLGTSNGEHDPDKAIFKGNLKGGDTEFKGDGGDAVWKENLLPEEQELLRSLSK